MSAEDPYDRTEPHASGANTDHDIIRILKIFNSLIIGKYFRKIFLRARGGGRAPAAQRPPVPVQRESARQVPLTRGRAARPQGDRGPGPALAIALLLQLTSTDPGHRQPAEYKEFNYYQIA